MAFTTVSLAKGEKVDIGTGNSTLYTVPASTNTFLLSCIVSNKTAGSVNVTVEVVRSGGATVISLVTNAPIPVGGSLECIPNKPPILATGDLVRVRASSAASLDALFSAMETA